MAPSKGCRGRRREEEEGVGGRVVATRLSGQGGRALCKDRVLDGESSDVVLMEVWRCGGDGGDDGEGGDDEGEDGRAMMKM